MAEETRIIRIIVDSSKAVDGSAGATRALERLERQTLTMDSTLARMERSLASVGTMVRAHLALAIADLAARMSQMAKDAINAAAGLEELAEQLGVTTDFLQGSQLAAVQSGVKLEQLEQAYSKFSQKMGEAAEGSKEMIEALGRLGVKNLDAARQLRPTEALMQDVAAAILKIEDPARRSAAAVDFFGKTGTRLLPMLKDIASGSDAMAARAKAAGTYIDESVIKSLDTLSDRAEKSSLRMRALFATIGAPIVTTALEAVNRILDEILGDLQRLRIEVATVPGRAARADASNLDDQLAAAKGLLAINPNNKMAQASVAALERRVADANRVANAQAGADAASMFHGDTPKFTPPAAAGAALSTAKGGGSGDKTEERVTKATEALKLAAAAQDEMTAAARRGDVAFQDQEIRLKAVQQAMSALGDGARAADPKVQQLARAFDELVRRDVQGKIAQSFVVATTELEKQNVLLETEIRLLEAAPEIRARELAVIKATQEAEKAGTALKADDIDKRRAAIETNERLKGQQDEIKKAQELWTEPFKRALGDIQSLTTDWIDKLLDGLGQGKLSLQDFGQAGIGIIRRMASELLSLAIVRPVLGTVASGLAEVGILSPNTVRQMGYGTAASGGAGSSGAGAFGGGGLGGLGGFSLPSWLGGGQPLAFLNRPIDPGTMAPGMYGPPVPGLGGMTWGNALGGALGIGSGIFQLASGRGSTGSMIGGIGSMVGGVLSMIPGMQPIGMGISLLSSLFGGLLGGGEAAPTPPLAGASVGYSWSGSRYGSTESQMNGGAAVAGKYGWVPQNLEHSFRRAGGVTNPGAVASVGIWQNYREGLTEASVGGRLIGQMSDNATPLIERAIGEAFRQSALGGALGNISATLETALGNYTPTSAGDVGRVIDFAEAYDTLGKELGPAKAEIEKISETFRVMSQTATQLGLALEPIEREQKAQTQRWAQDFVDAMLDPLAVQMRALEDEREGALASARYIKDNVVGVHVDMARIAEFYTRKEADLREQFYQGSVSSIEALIRQLMPGGSMSNLDARGQFAGVQATYRATQAQAMGGSQEAIQRFASEAAAYAESARSFFAGSSEYNRIRDEILAAAQTLQAGIMAPAGQSTPLNTNDPAVATLVQQTQILQQTVAALTSELRQAQAQNAQLLGKLSRLVANG